MVMRVLKNVKQLFVNFYFIGIYCQNIQSKQNPNNFRIQRKLKAIDELFEDLFSEFGYHQKMGLGGTAKSELFQLVIEYFSTRQEGRLKSKLF